MLFSSIVSFWVPENPRYPRLRPSKYRFFFGKMKLKVTPLNQFQQQCLFETLNLLQQQCWKKNLCHRPEEAAPGSYQLAAGFEMPQLKMKMTKKKGLISVIDFFEVTGNEFAGYLPPQEKPCQFGLSP